jgi:thioester reductase-like protein/pimeloyl-ACP methyl ester carboxylesterase
MNIFLTGGTGFIGKQIIKLIPKHHRIIVLVRSMNKFNNLVNSFVSSGHQNVVPVLGDLTQPNLGLKGNDIQLVMDTDIIIHAGGPMNIELDQGTAERVFLQASKEIAAIAQSVHQKKALKQFIHIVGFMSPYNEENFSDDQTGFHLEKAPPYEQMKFKADMYIRQTMHDLGIPLSVVNPSVVIGDSITGKTEQLGGLSILVDSTRRKLMPFVPGGKEHWIPMVHVDHVASLVSALVEEEQPLNNTYFLLDEKYNTPNMKELVTAIAKEVRVKAPVGAVSLKLMKSLLRMGVGKLAKIPEASMGFIVQPDFPTTPVKEMGYKHNLNISLQQTTLPFVITDLDYRLSHKDSIYPDNFHHSRVGNLTALVREGNGIPIIILHGTFAGADCFIPLANSLPHQPIWLVDLPGFGRSPYHHNPQTMAGYMNSVVDLILSFQSPVILIGHSFGGLVAAHAAEQLQERIKKLILLQPVLHPAHYKYRSSHVTKFFLSLMNKSMFKKRLLANGSFLNEKEIPDSYLDYVMEDLQSPRVRTSNSEVMSAISNPHSIQANPDGIDLNKLNILWGDKDLEYSVPNEWSRNPITHLPLGHQFPISHPELTAQWIQKWIQ